MGYDFQIEDSFFGKRKTARQLVPMSDLLKLQYQMMSDLMIYIALPK